MRHSDFGNSGYDPASHLTQGPVKCVYSYFANNPAARAKVKRRRDLDILKAIFMLSTLYPKIKVVLDKKMEILDADSDTRSELWCSCFDKMWSKNTAIVSNVSNAILGVSVFLVPWGYQMSGTLGGTLIVLLVAFCSYQTCMSMIIVQQSILLKTGEVCDYSEVVSACLGPVGGHVVGICTVISCLGASISYLIFFGHLLSSLLSIHYATVVFGSVPFLLLLAFVRSFHELSVFAGAGTVFVAATILLIALDNNSPSTSLFSLIKSSPVIQFPNMISFLGPATFLFTVHYCVMAISSEALREANAIKSRIHSVRHLEKSFSAVFNTPRKGPSGSFSSTTPAADIESNPSTPPQQTDQLHPLFNTPSDDATDNTSLLANNIQGSNGNNSNKDKDCPIARHTVNFDGPLRTAFALSCVVVIVHGITAMAIYGKQQ